ncbi:MAG: tetratricopeptide repeat protein [Phycisphaerae bacterium]|nr:tetratricopeptide repeat protein [Phycisphaerae bacterium]
MARRKRLNKRLVILLCAFGVILIAGLMIPLLAEPDPSSAAARGAREHEAAKAAIEQGDYEAATQHLQQAVRAYAQAANAAEDNADYWYELAQVHRTWSGVDQPIPSVTRSKSTEEWGEHVAALNKALTLDSNHRKAREAKAEVVWFQAHHARGGGWGPYIEEADKLLEIAPEHAVTYYRRGYANSRLFVLRDEDVYVQRAREDLRKATTLAPEEVDYWKQRLSFLEKYAPDALNDVYREALEHNPGNPELLVQHGQHALRREARIRDKRDLTEAEKQQADALHKMARQQFEQAIEAAEDTPVGHLALARLHLAEERPEEALAVLSKARQIAPDNGAVHLRLADAHAALDDSDAMIASLRDALDALPQPSRVGQASREQVVAQRRSTLVRLASLLLHKALQDADRRSALVDEVRQCVNALNALGGEPAGVLATLKAHIAWLSGDTERAVSILSQSLEEENLTSRGLNLLFNLYRQRDPGKAAKLLERLSATPDRLALRGLLQIQFRNYEQAARLVNRALASNPDHELAGQLRLALQALTRGATALPEDLTFDGFATNALLDAFMDRAEQLWAEDRQAAAVNLLTDLLNRAPTARPVISRLVTYYRRMNRPDAAERIIQAIKDRHPDDEQLNRFLDQLTARNPQERFQALLKSAEQADTPLVRHIAKAEVCATFNRTELFAEHVRKAAEIDPSDPRVVSLQFSHALSQEPPDWDLAEACVQRAREGNVDKVGGRYFEARLAAARGNRAAAIEAMDAAVEQRPGMKQWRMQLATLYRRTGQPDKAEQALRTVADADPTYAPAAIELASLLRARRRYDEFATWAIKAARLQPDDPRVKSWKQLIQENRADDDALEPFIRRRREMLKDAAADWTAQDLHNVNRLAQLCERAELIDQAERYYELLHRKSTNKLATATQLGTFHARQGNYGQLDAVMQDLLSSAPTNEAKSRAYVLYANILSGDKPDQAIKAYDAALAADAENAEAYAGKARLLARRGQLDKADATFSQALETIGETTSLLYQRAQVRLNTNRLSAAADDLDAVLAQAPDALQAMRLRAVVARRRNRPSVAKKYLNQALEMAPDSPDLLVQRAELHLSMNRPEAARADLQHIEMMDNPQMMAQVARAWMRLDEPDAAERILLRVLRGVDGDKPPETALRALIELYASQREWRRLVPVLRDAQRLFPDEPYYRLQEARMYAARQQRDAQLSTLKEAYESSPESLAVTGRYVDALLATDKPTQALQVLRNYEGNRPTLLEAYRARALLARGETAAGEKLLSSLLAAAEPRELGLIIEQVRVSYGSLARAANKLEALAGQREKTYSVQLTLGQWRMASGKEDAALRAFSRARDLAGSGPNRAIADYYIGLVHHQRNEPAAAVKSYRAALENNPQHFAALNNLAYLLSESNVGIEKLGEALKYAERARALRPEDANVQDTYGWILAQQGKHAEALEVLGLAVQIDRDNPTLRFHLGWAQEQLGELERAQAQYRQAKELDPEEGLATKIDEALRRVTEALRSRRETND